MSKNTQIGELINYISVDGSGNVVITGSLIGPAGSTYATQSYVTTAISNLVNAAPTALDTLAELSAALNNDASFATTVTNSLASKLALTGGTLTGGLTGTTATFSSDVFALMGVFTRNSADTFIGTSNNTSGIKVNGSTLETKIVSGGNVVATFANGGAVTLTGSITATNHISNITNGYGLILNRPSTTNYNGISYQTVNSAQWYVGMRENGTNNYIIYNENGTDALTISKSDSNVGIKTTGSPYSPLTVKGSNISWGETVTYYPSPSGYTTLAFRLEGADTTTGTWAFGKQSTIENGGIQYLQIAKNGLTGSSLHRPDAVQTWDPSNGYSYFGYNVGIGTMSPLEKLSISGNVHIAGVGNSLMFDTDASGRAISQYVTNLYEFHILNARGNSARFILGNGSISLGTTSTPQFFINTGTGNIGIGTTTVNGNLQFSNSTNTRKIVLYEGANNSFQFYGFGVESARLIYSTYTSGDDHVFVSGASATARTELMRVKGNGQVLRPLQPSFLAYSGSGGFTVTAGSWYNISNALTVVSYDIASNYSGGRFTAPVAGRYLFYAGGWSSISSNGERYAWSAVVNGGSQTFIGGGNYCLTDTPLSGYSIVYNLAAGDYVDLLAFSAVGGTWGAGTHRVYWGGYLL